MHISKIKKALDERVYSLKDMDEYLRFIKYPIPTESLLSIYCQPRYKDVIADFIKFTESFYSEDPKDMYLSYKKTRQVKGKVLGETLQPIRVAITGSDVSLPLFDIILFLGKDEVLGRLKSFLNMIGDGDDKNPIQR